MQSLIDKASQSGFFNSAEEVQKWKYDWVSIATKADDETTTNQTPSSGTLPTTQQKELSENVAKVKRWVKVTENAPTEQDDDVLEVFDLAKFNRLQKNTTASNGKNDSLNMADIRDAVGGSESIPGLSKAEVATTDDAPSAVEPNESDSVKPDAEGDVEMKDNGSS